MKKRLSLKKKQGLKGYLFILPWILGFFFLFLTPLIQTVSFSLSEISVNTNGFVAKFIGLENFRHALFIDPYFPRMLLTSMVELITDVPVILVFSFCAALLLKKPFKGIGIVKAIFFLTVIFSAGVFMKMQADTMSTNSSQASSVAQSMTILKGFDIKDYFVKMGIDSKLGEYINGYANNIFAVITRSGIQIFIFLAGLSSISESLYEACYIEGASGWETFWKITFPMISPLILVNIVYTVVDFFTSYLNSTLNYITNEAFGSFHYGYASALSWLYFLVISGMLGIVSLLISRKVFYQN